LSIFGCSSDFRPHVLDQFREGQACHGDKLGKGSRKGRSRRTLHGVHRVGARRRREDVASFEMIWKRRPRKRLVDFISLTVDFSVSLWLGDRSLLHL
ncbi:MAG: hypothetical protein AAF357_02225, partial [Verrucomicrobiota bacterium]